jgi:hypothetical protein
VHAGQTGDEALHAVVRAGDAVEHLGDRQPDGQEHAVEDVEDQHPGDGSSARSSSMRRNAASRRNPDTSIRRVAAYTTIAPSGSSAR